MNRRDVFGRFLALVGAAGAGRMAVAEIEPGMLEDPDPKRQIAVFRTKRPIPAEAANRIKDSWECVTKGTDWEGTKAIVLDADLDLRIERR